MTYKQTKNVHFRYKDFASKQKKRDYYTNALQKLLLRRYVFVYRRL